jgi:hypothetical protein
MRSRKITAILLCISFLIAACGSANAGYTDQPAQTAQPTQTPNGVLVQYFNNIRGEGLPNVVNIVPDLNFEIDSQAPAEGLAFDFSASWSGYIVPPKTDGYAFTVIFDDGGIFTLNGFELVNDWGAPTLGEHGISWIQLEAGVRYPFVIKLYDRNGAAKVKVTWSTQSGSIQNELIASSQFFLPEIIPTALPAGTRMEHEICVPNLSSKQNQFFAGTNVAPDIIYPGTVDELQRFTLSEADITGYMDGAYNVLIIPIGYADLHSGGFINRTIMLQSAVDQLGLDVHYSYLNQSLPIEVKSYDGAIRISDEMRKQVKDMIWSTAQPNAFMFDIQGQGRSSVGWVEDIPFLIIDPNTYLYASIHELGHALGLDDGYEDTLYSWGSFPNTELYFADADGHPIIDDPNLLTWMRTNPTTFIDPGFVCLEQKMLAMKGEPESIMSAWWDDANIFLEDGTVNPKLFTPFQKYIMQSTLRQILKE